MITTEFETTIGDDIDVTVIFEYTEDSDETGSYVETNLIKIYLTADKSMTDIQSLCASFITDDELNQEAWKAAQAQLESDEEDRAEHRNRRNEEY